jgi:hypothetical protein
MRIRILTGAALLALSVPALAYAQAGAAAGAVTGATGGAIVGGPIGAAVGAVGGALVGAVSDASVPKFRQYVVEEHVTSYPYTGELAVGTVLPEGTIIYHDIPREYAVTTAPSYRYTVVNDRIVVVDPATRRVVQIIDRR